MSLAAALVTLLPLHPENSNTTENTIETRKDSPGECEHSHVLCCYCLLLNTGAHGQDIAWLAGVVYAHRQHHVLASIPPVCSNRRHEITEISASSYLAMGVPLAVFQFFFHGKRTSLFGAGLFNNDKFITAERGCVLSTGDM